MHTFHCCSQHLLYCHPAYFHYTRKAYRFLIHHWNHQPFLRQSKVSPFFPRIQALNFTAIVWKSHKEVHATSAFAFSCLMEWSSQNESSSAATWFGINPAVPFTPYGTSTGSLLPPAAVMAYSCLTLLCQSKLTQWKDKLLAEYQMNL